MTGENVIAFSAIIMLYINVRSCFGVDELTQSTVIAQKWSAASNLKWMLYAIDILTPFPYEENINDVGVLCSLF